jgi:hypothetical protein
MRQCVCSFGEGALFDDCAVSVVVQKCRVLSGTVNKVKSLMRLALRHAAVAVWFALIPIPAVDNWQWSSSLPDCLVP